MPKGRKPVPTKLKVIRGNPGKRPLNKDEPQPAAGVPPAPAWLDKLGKKEWSYQVEQLVKPGVVTVVDGALLGLYCQAYSDVERLTKRIRREGEIRKGKRNPACILLREARELLRKTASELGLTPSSRSRIVAKPGEKVDPDAELFGDAK